MSGSAPTYGILLDPSVAEVVPLALDFPDGTSEVAAAAALEDLLTTEPDIEHVTIIVAGQVIGVSSRARLTRLGATLRSVGDGDGATLPGRSAQYRLLRFRCQRCQAELRRVHVDEREPPMCPNGHGEMRLVR